MRVIISLLIAGQAWTAWAHEPKDGDVHVSFGGFIHTTHPLHHYFKNPIMAGPALAVEADLGHRGGLEISFFYLRNNFSLVRDHLSLTENVKRVYISTGYRYWFNPRWSSALAFASSYVIGDPTMIRNDFRGPEQPGTSARDIAEYGLDFSVQYEPWREGRIGAIIDARYGLSVTPKRGEDSNHFGVFIGLKYFIQSREKLPELEQ